jgi:hypothetical protein
MKRLIEASLILIILFQIVVIIALFLGPDDVPALKPFLPKGVTIIPAPTVKHSTAIPTYTPTPYRHRTPWSEESETRNPAQSPTAIVEPTAITPIFPVVYSGSGSVDASAYYSLPPGKYVFRWTYQGAPGKGGVPANETSYHQYQLDTIQSIYQPLINLYNEFIDDATRDRDALALDEWQGKLNSVLQERDQEIAQENIRFQQLVDAYTDHTTFNLWITDQETGKKTTLGGCTGRGAGSVTLAFDDPSKFFFNISASGGWQVEINQK